MRKRDKNVISGYTNQYIEIMSADNIPNEYGGSDPGVTPYWQTYAKVNFGTVRRKNEAGISELVQAYMFTVRYRNDKNPQNDMTLKWRGVIFTIFGYDPDVVYQDYVTFSAVQANQGNLVVQPST